MKLKALFLLFILSLVQSFQTYAMELTQQENSGGVADHVTEITPEQDTLIEKINATFPDEIRQHIFTFCGQTYLYDELRAKIGNAQSYVELMQIQKEIIATAIYFKRLKCDFDIKDLKNKLESKKIGNLKKLQKLYNDFNASFKPVHQATIDIEHAQGEQINEYKHNMLWRAINAFILYNYDENDPLVIKAQKLLRSLCKTVNFNKVYNPRTGRSPVTALAELYYSEGFKTIEMLVKHGADVQQPDRNGKTVTEVVNGAYNPNNLLTRIFAFPYEYPHTLLKRRFLRNITNH